MHGFIDYWEFTQILDFRDLIELSLLLFIPIVYLYIISLNKNNT